MPRVNGFQANGRITNGRCHECGSTVQIQHGTYPGERWPRHLFWCDTCNGYRLTFVLDDYCQECRVAATAQPVYLIRVGGDCYYENLTTSYTVEEIQAAKARIKIKRPEPVAVQMRLL